jgi:hypothetical protein
MNIVPDAALAPTRARIAATLQTMSVVTIIITIGECAQVSLNIKISSLKPGAPVDLVITSYVLSFSGPQSTVL